MGLINNNLVSVIILNWNQREYTLNCLKSLRKVRYKPIEIVVVDNGSSDGTVNEVKKRYPKVKIISNTTNVGYAKGNNQGFAIAKGKYILFLNNDTEVTSDFVSELVKKISSKKSYGVVQSKLYWMSDKTKNDMVGAYMTPTGFVYYFGYGKSDLPTYMKAREIFFAKGASMITKREVVEKVGLFDEDFITYFEEYDFCWRVWLAGWKIVYSPKSVVYHKLNLTGEMLKRPFTVYLTFRNRIASMIKNLSLGYLFVVMPVHIFLCLLVSVFYFLSDPKLGKAVLSALGWNVSVLFKTLKKRHFIQKRIRKRSDLDIFMKNKLMVFPPFKYYLYLVKDMRFFKDMNL